MQVDVAIALRYDNVLSRCLVSQLLNSHVTSKLYIMLTHISLLINNTHPRLCLRLVYFMKNTLLPFDLLTQNSANQIMAPSRTILWLPWYGHAIMYFNCI